MESLRFREEQHFGIWVDVLSAVAMLGGAAAQLSTLAREVHATGIALTGWAVFWAIVLVIMANLFRVITEVDDSEVRVTFGRWVPYYWRRIPLDTIDHARVVTYRPMLDAGGWGIRWGRFEGHRCAFLNASGNRGVLLELDDGRRIIIGSKLPEMLHGALGAGSRRQGNR